jgi:hypothetical protein
MCRVVGDAQPVVALSSAGYRVVRARPCSLEGKRETWLHLIYAQGDREISFFVRSGRVTPASSGQLALKDEPSSRRVGELEVVGLRRGDYGIVVVGNLSRADALRMAVSGTQRAS